jgi:hypothetical protein
VKKKKQSKSRVMWKSAGALWIFLTVGFLLIMLLIILSLALLGMFDTNSVVPVLMTKAPSPSPTSSPSSPSPTPAPDKKYTKH